ncbi:hypothetical protein F2Q68_00017420 [Brassica cretica]|uniref:Uncharacterized protein n=1 Tax=Brassica cretica TaxID=69181 RepID=A0A8S9HLC3_BRACR|nr:hypothetical protein F2Q68_00017420 [Brassica cretica]
MVSAPVLIPELLIEVSVGEKTSLESRYSNGDTAFGDSHLFLIEAGYVASQGFRSVLEDFVEAVGDASPRGAAVGRLAPTPELGVSKGIIGRTWVRNWRLVLVPEGSETPRTTQDWSLHELYVTRLLDLAGHRFVLEFSLSLGSFRIFVSTTERWIRLGLGSAYIVFLRWALVGWSRVKNSQADVLANLGFALETNSQMSIPMLVLQWPATMEEPPSEEVSAVEEGEA